MIICTNIETYRDHSVSGGFVCSTIVRNNPKVGRNEKCPCGSNNKYKKCCLEVKLND